MNPSEEPPRASAADLPSVPSFRIPKWIWVVGIILVANYALFVHLYGVPAAPPPPPEVISSPPLWPWLLPVLVYLIGGLALAYLRPKAQPQAPTPPQTPDVAPLQFEGKSQNRPATLVIAAEGVQLKWATQAQTLPWSELQLVHVGQAIHPIVLTAMMGVPLALANRELGWALVPLIGFFAAIFWFITQRFLGTITLWTKNQKRLVFLSPQLNPTAATAVWTLVRTVAPHAATPKPPNANELLNILGGTVVAPFTVTQALVAHALRPRAERAPEILTPSQWGLAFMALVVVYGPSSAAIVGHLRNDNPLFYAMAALALMSLVTWGVARRQRGASVGAPR